MALPLLPDPMHARVKKPNPVRTNYEHPTDLSQAHGPVFPSIDVVEYGIFIKKIKLKQ